MRQTGLFRLAHLCSLIFDAHKVALDETSSIDEFQSRMHALGKLPLAAPYDPDVQVIPSHRAFGVFIQINGEDIGGVLSRHLDLGGDPVSHYMTCEARAHYKHKPTRGPAPTAKAMAGQVAYMGELFIHPDWRGKPGLAGALVRYMQCMSFSRWHLDWVFSVMKKHELERGRILQYGFCVVEPNAQDWTGVQDTRRSSDEYLLANSADQFDHVIQSVNSDPMAYLPGFKDLYWKAKNRAAGEE